MESAQSSSNNMQHDDSAQEARWEKQLSELARVESLVQKRKAELQRMDAVLIERRHELEDVVHKVFFCSCNWIYCVSKSSELCDWIQSSPFRIYSFRIALIYHNCFFFR